jgi:uncharacterized integral membrane protein
MAPFSLSVLDHFTEHRASLTRALYWPKKRRDIVARYIKSIIMIIILLFLVTFGVKNSQPIQIYYYLNFETGVFPLYGLVYLCIVIGIVIGMIVGIYDRIELRRRTKRLERENRELKEKVEEGKAEGEALSGPIPVEQHLADERPVDDRVEK